MNQTAQAPGTTRQTQERLSAVASVEAALRRWRSNLIDLTRRNPLLSLRPTRSSYLPITQPNVDRVFQRLVKTEKAWSFWLPPEEMPSAPSPLSLSPRGRGGRGLADHELLCGDLDRPRLLQVLTNLHRRARTDFLERGLHILYVACGILEWRDEQSKEPYRSPLVLVPVELARKSIHEPFVLKPTPDDPVLNPALEVRLRQDFNFRLPPLPEDWQQKTLLEYFEEVISGIAGLSGWRVDAMAALSLFSFFKGVIYRDLDDNAAALLAHPLVCAMAGAALPAELQTTAPSEAELDAVQDPRDTHYVLDADGSQRLALEAAARGQSFVLQGPPGTGKSQTITNLISDAIARGKKVLFVSEKMAALEVVYKRLRHLGLGDFCLELHSHKTNKRDIIAELARCYQHAPREVSPPACDYVKLQQRRDQLNRYVTALHAIREPFQRSAWSGYCELAACGDLPLIPLGMPKTRREVGPADNLLALAELSPAWLDDAQQAMRRLAELWRIRSEMDFPWWGYKCDKYSLQVRDDVLSLIERVEARIERVLVFAKGYSNQIGVLRPLPELLRAGELLESSPENVADHWLRDGNLDKVGADLDAAAKHYERFAQARAPLTQRYGADIWHVPDGTAEKLEDAWLAVAPLLTPGDVGGAALLKHQQHLRGWAADTQKRALGLIAEARTLEKWLAIPLPKGAVGQAFQPAAADRNVSPTSIDPSPYILRQLQRLANLCQSTNAPERTWVHSSEALQKARAAIAANRPQFAEYHRQRKQLLERYTETFFTLDLARIAEGYAGPYRSWFRWFNKQYRRDRRAVKRSSRAEHLPRNYVADINLGRDLLAMQERFEAERPSRQELLGRYEEGLETDFDVAERATRVAAETVELVNELGCETLPGRFLDALCAGKGASDKIRAATKRLHDLLGDWLHTTESLKDVLPLAQFPQLGEPLEEAALSVLVQYAKDLQAKLNNLAAITDIVLAHAPAAPPPDLATMVADLRQAEKLRREEKEQETEAARWQQSLGGGFKRVDTNWDSLRKAYQWACRVCEFFHAAPPEVYIRFATHDRQHVPSLKDLHHAIEQYHQALHGLEVRFSPPSISLEGKRLVEHLPERVKERLAVLRSRVAELADWVDWSQMHNRFAHLGLTNFFDALLTKELSAERLAGVFNKAVFSEWLEMIVEQDAALAAFRRPEHERHLAEFQDCDRRWVEAAAQQVIQKVDGQRPDPKDLIPGSEGALLLKEAAKKSRHLPLRQLFEAMPRLMLRLKPCMLMSPLSVSQFLPQLKFDIVVFDEASQVCPEDAVGAIYRGKQAVIAGDDQQLPPTSFFQQIADDDEEADEVETTTFESVLDACRGSGLPQRMLCWHYRSRHEDLIAFSNEHFYDRRLVTFPAAWAAHPDLGIKFHHVPDGVYDRGGQRDNVREAEDVAEMVFEHLRTSPQKTLGVITFSLPQMSAIEKQIERRLVDHPELESHFTEDRLDGFFVKNLEAVQGDQRDVIIFSVGYGRDKEGRLPMNFGPLNQDGGHRRLNVAVTRAREKLIMVSSIRSQDFSLGSTPVAGVHLLQRYLMVAEQGANADADTPPAPRNALERDIVQELESRGYQVIPQVGAGADKIDLAVLDPTNPKRFLLGIEWDGPDYATSATARDRDRLRQQVLQDLGWKIHRLWAPDWLYRRTDELERLCQELEKALAPSPPGGEG